MNTVKALFRSRKFLTGLISVIVGLIALRVPEFVHVQTEVTTLLVVIASAVIGGIAYEDAAKLGREIAVEPVQTPKEALVSIATEVIEEVIVEDGEKA